jgi:hypothetical protein
LDRSLPLCFFNPISIIIIVTESLMKQSTKCFIWIIVLKSHNHFMIYHNQHYFTNKKLKIIMVKQLAQSRIARK